jgi:hypothetical protein
MVLAQPRAAAYGADLDLTALECEPELALFSERPAIVFEVPVARATRLYQAARERRLLAWPIGTVGRQPGLRISAPESLAWSVEELRAAVDTPLARLWNEELE